MAIDRGKVVRCGQSANTGLEEEKQDEYLICVSALRSASHHSNEQLFKQHNCVCCELGVYNMNVRLTFYKHAQLHTALTILN